MPKTDERGNNVLSARDCAILYMPEIPKIEAERNQLKNQNSVLLKQIQELKLNLSNSDKTSDYKKCVNMDKSHFVGIISEKEKEIKDREKMVGIKDNTIQSLEEVIKMKESYVESLLSQLKITEQRSSDLHDESVKLQQKYMASEKTAYELKVKNVDLMKSIKEDKVQANLQRQLKTTEQKASDLQDESVKLQNKFKAFEEKISVLEKKNAEFKTSLQAEKEKSCVKTSSTQQMSEHFKKTLQEKKDLELRCIKLSKQVSNFEKILITERDTFTKERKVLEDKNTELPK
ncbi:hypothetical protein L6452_06048 [Arctium lappa]|uniref:Uncharacterized protein n=1 Tax=Arctium lappa TaxID=4217 RepID=A0ACB9EHL1_ARCLA|nr:hypothetical protein L6452_06048 [Arctium lappa]